jgi:hypothetical protein
MTAPAVYAAIGKVQGEMARVGIAKGRNNAQQGYAFRGIDDVYAALSPVLAEAGLCVIPRMISRDVAERATRNGGVLYDVTVHAEFDFVAVADGSKHTASTYGEASDSGDKATNKAMSAAYKYAAFMTFAIPTEGDNDADAVSPEPTAPPRDWAAWAVDFIGRISATEAAADLVTLRDNSAADRAQLKAFDPNLNASVNAAYKARASELAPVQQKEAA